MPESDLEDLEGFMPEDTMIRIPVQLAERADQLIPLLDKRRDLLAWGRLSRAAVVRIALERGLADLARELAPAEHAEPSNEDMAELTELSAELAADGRGTYGQE